MVKNKSGLKKDAANMKIEQISRKTMKNAEIYRNILKNGHDGCFEVNLGAGTLLL